MKATDNPVCCSHEDCDPTVDTPDGSQEGAPPGNHLEESAPSPVDSDNACRELAITTSTCPVWCDPQECTAQGDSGYHQSRRGVVPATDNEACTASVAVVLLTPGDQVLFELGVQHDPTISAALDMPTEPDFFFYTPLQMRNLHAEIGQLLSTM